MTWGLSAVDMNTLTGVLAAIVMFLGGILGYVVRALITGRLVSRTQVQDLISERDYYRATTLESVRQNSQLMETAHVQRDVLGAIQEKTS